jgi:hypothetical protein
MSSRAPFSPKPWQVEQLLGDTREVQGWLEQRVQAATITGLYGKS